MSSPYFRRSNRNPLKRHVTDCVVRSISRATNEPWLIVFLGLVKIAMTECCIPNDKICYEKYLEQNGWRKMPQPTYRGRQITGRTFLKRIRRKSDIIVSIGKEHLTVIHAGKFTDTWDCSNEIVGNYWVKRH